MTLRLLISLMFAVIWGAAHGQSAVRLTYDTARVKSMVRVSLNYRSDYYYMGRADSAKAPYLVPAISYFHKSGFFVSGSMSYLAAENQRRIDLITASAGYDYFGKRIATGISVSEYFFDPLSYSVQAEMSTYISTYFGYDFDIFMVVVDASMGVSDQWDIFLGGEINRSFYMLNDRLRLTPSFYTNFGTQHYYNEYYTQRSVTTGSKPIETPPGSGTTPPGTGPGTGPGSGSGSGSGSGGSRVALSTATPSGPITTETITEVYTLESEKFQLLDYELGLQASYSIKNFRIITSGTVMFPVNPSKVVTDVGTYEEILNTGFLWTVGVRYTFR